jgi:L-2-hydroxyglutarate oxidase LhgO
MYSRNIFQVVTGATVRCCQRQVNGGWMLETDTGATVVSHAVINCAGLYGDVLDTIGGLSPSFRYVMIPWYGACYLL